VETISHFDKKSTVKDELPDYNIKDQIVDITSANREYYSPDYRKSNSYGESVNPPASSSYITQEKQVVKEHKSNKDDNDAYNFNFLQKKQNIKNLRSNNYRRIKKPLSPQQQYKNNLYKTMMNYYYGNN
jgi:hypothetical protein